MKKTNRKWIWIVVVVAVVATAAFLGLRLLRDRVGVQTAAAGTGDIVSAFQGDLAASASASGEVVAQQEASLALSLAGTVAELNVKVGDIVQAGDQLLALETTELERAVESAQQALTIQESNLATLLAPPSTTDLAAAQASVASAQASLDDLLAGPSAEEITATETDLRSAQADVTAATAQLSALWASASEDEIYAAGLVLEQAQRTATLAAERHSTILVMEPSRFIGQGRIDDMELSARAAAVQANAALAAAQETLDQLLYGDPNAIASAQASLAIAEARRDVSQAQLDLLLMDPSQAQVLTAEANLAQAVANLDRLQQGPSNLQITSAEVAVEQARINLDRAVNTLNKATLLAPFDGVITAVHVGQGEQASGILIEMVDPDSLEIVLDVDEVDIGDLAVGQEASVTLETWPDQEIPGQVVSIAPRNTSGNSAIISYHVYLSLGETDLPVLVGMTANADLMTIKQTDVLLLPNVAIKVDRQAGTYSVNRVTVDSSGSQVIDEVEITIGMRDGQHTQITSGLQEGDQVMVGNVIPGIEFGGGPPNGGNGMFGRGN